MRVRATLAAVSVVQLLALLLVLAYHHYGGAGPTAAMPPPPQDPSPDLLPSPAPEPALPLRTIESVSRVVGFYNLFSPSLQSVAHLLREHLTQIATSAVFEYTSQVSVQLVAPPPEVDPTKVFVQDILRGRAVFGRVASSGDEAASLGLLWEFCTKDENADAVVWYIHSKGSYHPREENDWLRRTLTRYVLSQECLDEVASGYHACGARFVRHPHGHYPGNMWIARCDYLRFLPNPVLQRGQYCGTLQGNELHTLQYSANLTTACLPGFCIGTGRYSVEHWVGSFVDANMSDCMSYSVDKRGRYWAYYVGYSKLFKQEYGLNCSSAPRPDLEAAYLDMRTVPRFPESRRDEFAACHDINMVTDRAIYGLLADRQWPS
eukprot:TRINITY_DN3801_c0_g1_i2.p1 TRINITY_DN3801_c0_g1~~TRINITY_DN3801_c0_g1_i2.p1  ORF type:complete len:377 (-),score=69.49 TRINITY_DN3801_c0_g1_i2:97-1227(-)